ncbi:DUF2835 domain-containing protein [Vibrio sp. RC27]
MKQYYFTFSVTYQSYSQYYSGQASNVLIVTECGLKLQLPASRFRSFLTHTGIQGRFVLTTDANNKFVSLTKI